MHQIFLPPPDLSVFFPRRPPSLRSLHASHRALSCLSSPLLIFLFSSVESAQARLNHINLWVVRVSHQWLYSQWDQITFKTNQIVRSVRHRLHLAVTCVILTQTVTSECPSRFSPLITWSTQVHLLGAPVGVFHAGVAATVQGWFVCIHQNSS